MLFALAMSSVHVERTFWQRLVDTTGLTVADLRQHIRVWMYVDDVTLRASDGWQLMAKETWEAASAAHGLLLRHDKTTLWTPSGAPPEDPSMRVLWEQQSRRDGLHLCGMAAWNEEAGIACWS
eukprot:1577416-Amphidinium_carterae.3